tara:strand:+ start:1048 stop:1617 length:570 start_codon:yes stop_codon:yes gene_type:complete
MYLINKILLILIIIVSCKPIEKLQTVEIDNSRLDVISLNAKDLLVDTKYASIFSDNNIEDKIANPPIEVLKSWISENIKSSGNQNRLVVNIIDASITKEEIKNEDAKKYEEKTIFLYEIFYLVEYILYDDSGFILANTNVESFRSTTSQKYISLNESELIINELIYNSLIDFTKESKSMINFYMEEYLL